MAAGPLFQLFQRRSILQPMQKRANKKLSIHEDGGKMMGKDNVKERVKSEKRADFVPAVFQSFLEKVTHKKKQLRKEQMNFQGMDAFFCNTANTTCRRTRGFCRCYVVQCRSHMKNKGTQLNDRPRPKCSPTAISQLVQTFRRW